jgi:hypothetical protein
MARIAAPAKLGWFARLVRRAAAKQFGMVPEPLDVQAHHGTLLFGSAMMELAQNRARTLPLRIKALAELCAATRVGCPW